MDQRVKNLKTVADCKVFAQNARELVEFLRTSSMPLEHIRRGALNYRDRRLEGDDQRDCDDQEVEFVVRARMATRQLTSCSYPRWNASKSAAREGCGCAFVFATASASFNTLMICFSPNRLVFIVRF